jgi:hypothetical protein
LHLLVARLAVLVLLLLVQVAELPQAVAVDILRLAVMVLALRVAQAVAV